MNTSRTNSQKLDHIREDLTASLVAALGPAYSVADHDTMNTLVASIENYGDVQATLIRVLDIFGPAVFGSVTMFHFKARTSLADMAAGLTMPRRLEAYGFTVKQMEWPPGLLNAGHRDLGVENPRKEAHLRAAIDAWKLAHPDEPLRTSIL